MDSFPYRIEEWRDNEFFDCQVACASREIAEAAFIAESRQRPWSDFRFIENHEAPLPSGEKVISGGKCVAIVSNAFTAELMRQSNLL